MEKILQDIEIPYLTTEYLLYQFKDYNHPRDKLKNLLKKRELIHLTQGIYLLGADYQRHYSKEVLSGIIFGPSAISFEYALSYYGLIPEKVETLTCLCFKRNKEFLTPVGKFSYRYIPAAKFSMCLSYEQTKLGNFFIATREKAICDMAYFQKLNSDDEALEYVLNDLRISEDHILKFDSHSLVEIKRKYNKKSVNHLVDSIMIFQNRNR